MHNNKKMEEIIKTPDERSQTSLQHEDRDSFLAKASENLPIYRKKKIPAESGKKKYQPDLSSPTNVGWGYTYLTYS